MPTRGNTIPKSQEHREEPSPNVKMEMAVRSPFAFDVGNQSSMFLFGVTYPHPSEIPHRTPAPIHNNQMLFNVQAIPERANPARSKMDEVRAERRMWRSASGPNMAAPIPKKKMLRQNVN